MKRPIWTLLAAEVIFASPASAQSVVPPDVLLSAKYDNALLEHDVDFLRTLYDDEAQISTSREN